MARFSSRLLLDNMPVKKLVIERLAEMEQPVDGQLWIDRNTNRLCIQMGSSTEEFILYTDVESLYTEVALLKENKVNKSDIGVTVPSLVGGKIPVTQLPDEFKAMLTVPTYADLPTEGLYDGMNVFVTDATGDPTVKSGWAIYKYTLSQNVWIKISEGESLDVIVNWSEIEDKPDTFPPEAHTHSYAGSSVSGGAANEALYCSGNSETAGKLVNEPSITITDSDGTNSGDTETFKGDSDITLKLPSTIKANLSGNASTATNLNHNISVSIKDSDESHEGSVETFNGSQDLVIKLPPVANISILGNANTANTANACTGQSNSAVNDGNGNEIAANYAPMVVERASANVTEYFIFAKLVKSEMLNGEPSGFTAVISDLGNYNSHNTGCWLVKASTKGSTGLYPVILDDFDSGTVEFGHYIDGEYVYFGVKTSGYKHNTSVLRLNITNGQWLNQYTTDAPLSWISVSNKPFNPGGIYNNGVNRVAFNSVTAANSISIPVDKPMVKIVNPSTLPSTAPTNTITISGTPLEGQTLIIANTSDYDAEGSGIFVPGKEVNQYMYIDTDGEGTMGWWSIGYGRIMLS